LWDELPECLSSPISLAHLQPNRYAGCSLDTWFPKEQAMRRFIAGCLIALIGVSAAPRSVRACYFGTPSSLFDGLLDAPILVVGQFRNQVAPNNALPNGQVELVVKEAVIPHAILKDRKTLLLPQRISWNGTYLVALQMIEGKLEMSGARDLDDKGEILKFVRGAVGLKDKSQIGRMRYVVDWLGNSNDQIAQSAQLELDRAEYADFRKMAETLKPEPLAAALKDPKTSAAQRGMCARLLGHCGKKEHATLLRKMIDDAKEKRDSRYVEGLMFGYALLEPQAGWDLIVNCSVRPEPATFLCRYGAYCAMRRLGDQCPDLVASKK
jgi:hypothetical protein